MLCRFMKQTMASDTMQGWSKNDSGQWMYYEDGIPVIGKKTIDAFAHTFDKYGVTSKILQDTKKNTYTVQKGDSFWLIARKLNCSVEKLNQLNSKVQPASMLPGTILNVPKK